MEGLLSWSTSSFKVGHEFLNWSMCPLALGHECTLETLKFGDENNKTGKAAQPNSLTHPTRGSLYNFFHMYF